MKQPAWSTIFWLIQIPLWAFLVFGDRPTLPESAREAFRFGASVFLLILSLGYGIRGIAIWFGQKNGAAPRDKTSGDPADRSFTLGIALVCAMVAIPVVMTILLTFQP